MDHVRLTIAEAKHLYVSLCRRGASAAGFDETTLSGIGYLVDIAGDLDRQFGLHRAIEWAIRVLPGAPDELSMGRLHYCIANAWANLRHIQRHHETGSPGESLAWEERTGVSEIAHLRAAAAALGGEVEGVELRTRVLTNLGNALNTRGRLIEALEAWDAALDLDPTFGMANGNRGIGLKYYAALSYDPQHSVWLIRESFAALDRVSSDEGTYPRAVAHFATVRDQMKARWSAAVLERPTEEWTPSRAWSDEERSYREWCMRERLFLNVLNDIDAGMLAMADVLALPSYVTRLHEGPALLGFFNQIKQEYVSARLLLYEARTSTGVHFGDRDVTLINTLDYPVYSIASDRGRLAFRSLYSLLDKIAFFLNDYLGLGIPEKRVHFRTFWYERQDQKRGLLKAIEERINAPLRALYWLAQDFYEPGQLASDLDAQRMDAIRHELEHKYLKLHLMGPATLGRALTPGPMDDRLAYSINQREFDILSLRLARVIRAAIVYTMFAVHEEERARKEGRAEGTIDLPIELDTWDDDWKE